MHRLHEPFICLCGEVGFWRVRRLRVVRSTGKMETLFSINRFLPNQIQHLFARDKFGPSKTVQISFVWTVGDGEEESLI